MPQNRAQEIVSFHFISWLIKELKPLIEQSIEEALYDEWNDFLVGIEEEQ